MKIVGDLNNPKIMLVHGAGFYWENCFREIMESLKSSYCILLPVLPGHSNINEEPIKSVEQVAAMIIKEIKDLRVDNIELAYGISLGASIVLETILCGEVNIKKVILDGGQYINMGENIELFSNIMSKQFIGLLENNHLQKEIRDNMGYDENDIEVLKPMLFKSISNETLYSTFKAAYSYDITNKNSDKLATKDISVSFGSREIYAKDSLNYLEKLIKKELEVEEIKDMGHSEALSKHPEIIIEMIKSRIK